MCVLLYVTVCEDQMMSRGLRLFNMKAALEIFLYIYLDIYISRYIYIHVS